MIERDHQLPITRQAKLLGMSRGSVYYLPRPTGAADLAMMLKIDKLHLEHPFMGARMLCDQLRREGIRVGRRYIRTLMQRMGIEALAPQPRHQQTGTGPQDLPLTAAQAGDHPSQPGMGAGHHLHPNGPRVRLSHRSGGRGQPPRASS